MLRRFGYLSLILGALSWVLFVTSELARDTNFNFFFIGLVLLVFGLIALRSTAPPPSEGPRYFRTVRRLLGKKRNTGGDGEQ